MKKLYLFLFIIALAVLEAVFLNSFNIFGTRPNILLAVVSFAALSFNFGWAFVIGMFAGALRDAFGLGGFYLNTFLFSLWVFLITKISSQIVIEEPVSRALLVFVVVLAHNLVFGLIIICQGQVIPAGIFFRILFLASVYTALISPLIYTGLSYISGRDTVSS